MKIALVLAGGALFCAANAWSQSAQPTPPQPQPLTSQEVQSINAAIYSQLIDPGSAMFKDMILYRQHGTPIVCGLLNAKNRMGGYSGFTPFTAIPGNAMIFQEGQSEALWQKDWETFCRNEP